MKRKLISMLVMVLSVAGIQAATEETTLWEGEQVFENYYGLQIDKGDFATVAAGDVITVTITACKESDAKFAFKQKDNGWKELTGFKWVDVTEPFEYQYTVTETTATELKSYGLVIQGNNITVTKVKLIQTVPDPITITTLWSGTEVLGEWANFEDLRYGGKGELANAKVGDIIRVTLESILEGSQIYVCDAASYAEFANGYFEPAPADETYVEYMVTDALTMKSICDRGIVVKGKWATLTKIELITSDESYDAIDVTIGEDGIATFSSAKHHSFAAAGITPYYVSEISTGSVTLTPIEDKTTWSYQGYILKGEPGVYTIPVVESNDDATYPSGTNYLKATEEYERTLPQAGEEGKYIYIFAKYGDGIGFYYLNGESYTLAAHRAYLLTDSDIRPASGARVAFNFDDGDPTAVVSVGENKQDNVYYNLNGMRVTNPSKGVYVVNGKKVIIK